MDDDPGTEVLPWTKPEPPVTAFARRVTDLGLGAASLMAGAAVGAIERFGPAPADTAPRTVGLLPGALVGFGLEAQRRLLDVTGAAERGAGRVTRVVARLPVVGSSVRVTETYLEGWRASGSVAQARNRALVTEFVQRLAPEVATAVVAQLDVEALVDQLPIDAILARVDVNALLARIDVDGIVRRVDVDALMQRVDIVPIAQEVVREVDIASIVRESTGTIGGDARDGVRITSMRVDGFVSRVADRIMFRRHGRRTELAGYDPGPAEVEE